MNFYSCEEISSSGFFWDAEASSGGCSSGDFRVSSRAAIFPCVTRVRCCKVISPRAAVFVEKIVTEMRKVDVEGELAKSGKKPNFDVVNDIIVDAIFDKVV
jgi:hypothetical protein